MADPVEVVSLPEGESAQVNQAETATPKGDAAPGFDEMGMSATVGSVNELKSKAPELYEGVLKGIAQRIISGMKKHTENFKRIQRENR